MKIIMKYTGIDMKIAWDILMKMKMKYPWINDYENVRDSYEMANFQSTKHYTWHAVGNCLVFIIKVVTTSPTATASPPSLQTQVSGVFSYCLLLFAQEFVCVISNQNVQHLSAKLILHISQHPTIQILCF